MKAYTKLSLIFGLVVALSVLGSMAATGVHDAGPNFTVVDFEKATDQAFKSLDQKVSSDFAAVKVESKNEQNGALTLNTQLQAENGATDSYISLGFDRAKVSYYIVGCPPESIPRSS